MGATAHMHEHGKRHDLTHMADMRVDEQPSLAAQAAPPQFILFILAQRRVGPTCW